MAADDTGALPEPETARRALGRMIGGFHITQLIHAAARLRLADLLHESAMTSEELARQTGAHAPFLTRLLRALVEIDVLCRVEEGRFRLTRLGMLLREDAPDSMRPAAIVYGGSFYRAWGSLLESVMTGQTAFEEVFGAPFFDYYARHPEEGAAFDQTMTSLNQALVDPVAAAYDFSGMQTVIDIGGGQGTLLAAILKANPGVKGILFDQPAVVEGARACLTAAGLVDRCSFVSGDFFSAVPEGGDAYVMKWILHDWDDERSITILKNCRQAMPGRARLLLVETVLPDQLAPGPAGAGVDVHMLVLTGGRERTESEFRALLAAAGLQLTRIIPTEGRSPIFGAALSIIEAAPAGS